MKMWSFRLFGITLFEVIVMEPEIEYEFEEDTTAFPFGYADWREQ